MLACCVPHIRCACMHTLRMYAYATHVHAICMLACCVPHIRYAFMCKQARIYVAESTVHIRCIRRQAIHIRVAHVLCILACSLSRYGLFISCTASSSARACRSLSTAATTCGQHTSAYVSIRQHTSAYVSIRQHTSAYVSIRQLASACPQPPQPAVSIRPHTSAYVSVRQRTSACVSIRQHASAYVFSRRNVLLHRTADCIHIFVICSRAGLIQ